MISLTHYYHYKKGTELKIFTEMHANEPVLQFSGKYTFEYVWND